MLAQINARLALPLWRGGELAGGHQVPTRSTGWPALDDALPGSGWPMAGLTELLGAVASGELTLLAPWLRLVATGAAPALQQPLLWVAPPGLPCATALQALGLQLPQLVLVTPATAADAAWAAEQALRSGNCAAVLLWCHGWDQRWSQGLGDTARDPPALASTGLRRLHLAAQAGSTPLMALRPLGARAHSSPAPLRLSCVPGAGRRLAVDVFKRRGPPLAEPLQLSLPWPVAVRRALRTAAAISSANLADSASLTAAAAASTADGAGATPSPPSSTSRHAVDRPASAAPATASAALVATGA